jgi:menaquinone-9 beta-reductase
MVFERLTAGVLIGADGRNSWIAHRLGLARPNESDAEYVGVQAQVKNSSGTGSGIHIHLFPAGYAGVVGVGGGLTNVCFAIDKKILKRCCSTTELWEKSLYHNPFLKEQLERSEIVGPVRTAFPVYFAPRRCWGDGFLLAGDAARVTEPVTGEGVFFALQSGILAAETVDRAFQRGDLSAQTLCPYLYECRKAFSRRRAFNHLVRAVVHRPLLAGALVRFSAAIPVPMNFLVRAVCAA